MCLVVRGLTAYTRIHISFWFGRQLQELVSWTLSEPMLAHYLRVFRDTLWPGGSSLNDQHAVSRTDEQRARTRKQAQELLARNIPGSELDAYHGLGVTTYRYLSPYAALCSQQTRLHWIVVRSKWAFPWERESFSLSFLKLFRIRKLFQIKYWLQHLQADSDQQICWQMSNKKCTSHWSPAVLDSSPFLFGSRSVFPV